MLKALRTPTALLNSQLLASRTPSSSLALRVAAHAARSYATETPLPSTSSANSVGKNGKGGQPEGPLRPHLGVEVNPNHGLWSFFRKTVGKNGAVAYETLEAKDDTVDYSGAFLLRQEVLFTEMRVRLVNHRSCMERGRDSTKELQRPSHPLVRRSEGKKPPRDAVTRGEAHVCPAGHDVDQETYIQGKCSTFTARLTLMRRSL